MASRQTRTISAGCCGGGGGGGAERGRLTGRALGIPLGGGTCEFPPTDHHHPGLDQQLAPGSRRAGALAAGSLLFGPRQPA
jgi:hypothetical protein